MMLCVIASCGKIDEQTPDDDIGATATLTPQLKSKSPAEKAEGLLKQFQEERERIFKAKGMVDIPDIARAMQEILKMHPETFVSIAQILDEHIEPLEDEDMHKDDLRARNKVRKWAEEKPWLISLEGVIAYYSLHDYAIREYLRLSFEHPEESKEEVLERYKKSVKEGKVRLAPPFLM